MRKLTVQQLDNVLDAGMTVSTASVSAGKPLLALVPLVGFIAQALLEVIKRLDEK